MFTPYDSDTLAKWKAQPLCVPGPRSSKCHCAPTLLVRGPGRDVFLACSECGHGELLPPCEFPELNIYARCPLCRVQSSRVPGTDKPVYVCHGCKHFAWLADILPSRARTQPHPLEVPTLGRVLHPVF